MGVCLRKINYGESPTSFNPSMIRTENSTKTTTYFDSVLDNNCDIIGLIVQYLDGKSTLHMKKSKIFEFFIPLLNKQLRVTIDIFNAKYKYYLKLHPHANPLIVSCTIGNLNDVKVFLDNYPYRENSKQFASFINQKGRNNEGYPGYTGLIIASRHEHFDVVEYLLQHEEIDLMLEKDGWNALHLACVAKKNLKIIKMMLKHPKCSIDVINAVNDEGYETPLDLAFYNTNNVQMIEIQNLLIKNGGKRSRNLHSNKRSRLFRTRK